MSQRYALLVIDIQNDYCHSEGRMSKAGRNVSWLQETVIEIRNFIKKVEQMNIPVIYVRTCLIPKNLSKYEIEKQKNNNIYGICEINSWGSDFFQLQPRDKDIIIDKQHYSAFFETNLLKKLRNKKIDNLIIIGSSTHICIDSTVRDAYQYGFGIIVAKDLVATREEERKYHDFTLNIIQKQYGKVLSSNEILKLVGAKTQISYNRARC